METNQATEQTLLSAEQKGTIGEITNIAMGGAASTLSLILGQEIDLSTPEVLEVPEFSQLEEPFASEAKMLVSMRFVQGFQSASALIMREQDARMIAAMVMGGAADAEAPWDDLQQNAVVDALAQMMDAAAINLGGLVRKPVEISRPSLEAYSPEAVLTSVPNLAKEPITAVSFAFKLANGQSISFMQYSASSEAIRQVNELMAIAAEPDEAGDGAAAGNVQVNPVTVRPVEFSSFDNQQTVYGEENKNLALVMDVTLSLTVELGKTELSIKDVLELTRGSVVELDRVAGEPVDLLANGKLIAKGEVVVIEDNFGLRITSIVSPADRLRGM